MQQEPTSGDSKNEEHEETSRKTLKDIEKETKTSSADDHNSEAPSPDGAFDESNEIQKADPL